MKLTKTQFKLLSAVASSPAMQGSADLRAVHSLWRKGLVDIFCHSVHITEAGRAALKEMGE